MDQDLKRNMLLLARNVLENELYHSNHDLSELNCAALKEKRGLFVTLHKDRKLRGCIGRLEANHSIFGNIIELSKAAAFEDHRFKKLTAKELKKISIEISLLSKPTPVKGDSTIEKVMKIKPKQDGVILSTGHRHATFLPQVWDVVPIREDFISDLCRKAGLEADYWQRNQLEISTYRVEHFEEESLV